MSYIVIVLADESDAELRWASFEEFARDFLHDLPPQTRLVNGWLAQDIPSTPEQTQPSGSKVRSSQVEAWKELVYYLNAMGGGACLNALMEERSDDKTDFAALLRKFKEEEK
jgi:hypothetical protein